MTRTIITTWAILSSLVCTIIFATTALINGTFNVAEWTTQSHGNSIVAVILLVSLMFIISIVWTLQGKEDKDEK